jgi:hypothetical protein
MVEDINLSDLNLNKLIREFPKVYSEGYSYFYIKITLVFDDGTTQTLQTVMHSVKEFTNSEQIKDLISESITEYIMRYGIAVENNNR